MIKETVVMFGNTKSLTGIITDSPEAKRAGDMPAVVFMNAGLIHRVGPNRLYVKLARALASMGFVAFRFDLSGIGDSQPREDHLTYDKSSIEEAQEAMNYLAEARGCKRFLFMGHCSGAFNSYRVACSDSRVAGVALINLEGGGDEWVDYDRKRKLSQYYQNYYGKSVLADPEKWKKLLTGKADYASIARNVFQNIIWNRLSAVGFRLKSLVGRESQAAQSPEKAQAVVQLRALIARRVQLLLIHPEGSTGLVLVRTMLGNVLDELRAAGKLQVEIIPQSDHLFTLLSNQKHVLRVIQNWAEKQINPV